MEVTFSRLFVLFYSDEGKNSERYYLRKGIIKNYNVIINGKNFYDQPIDSDIKQYKEKRNLAVAKGQDYTTECLSDYHCIKNYYRLIGVDLSWQKELNVDLKAI